MSAQATDGKPSGGKAAWTSPTTTTPLPVNESAETAIVAPMMATSGAGKPGQRRETKIKKAKTPSATENEYQLIVSSSPRNSRNCPRTWSDEMDAPETREICEPNIIMATPARYPISTGLDSQSATNPSFTM